MTLPARLVRLDGPGAMPAPLRRRFNTIGRDPEADIAIAGPSTDEVGGRHAAIFANDPVWMVRDLDTGAGTWLNGIPLTADHPLVSGDRIRLGESGPELRFEIMPAVASPDPGRGRSPAMLTGMMLVALTLAAGWYAVTTRRAAERERRELLARVDSLSAAIGAARVRESRLTAELAAADSEAAAARARIDSVSRSGDPLDALSAAVRELVERRAPLLSAATLDPAPIEAGNREAVALVLAQRADGRVVSGTGFAIASTGDTSWVVTSRHLVADSAGRPATRLGLLFEATAQNFPAVVVQLHPTADLALLRVVVRGGTPVVERLGDGIRAGSAVATITFPAGLDLAPTAPWRRVGVTAELFVATVVAADPDRIQLDGYGTQGMSGSPVFAATGEVVGVIFGGAADGGGRVVFAVPVARVRELRDK